MSYYPVRITDFVRESLCSRHVHHVVDGWLGECEVTIFHRIWGTSRRGSLTPWVNVKNEIIGVREWVSG